MILDAYRALRAFHIARPQLTDLVPADAMFPEGQRKGERIPFGIFSFNDAAPEYAIDGPLEMMPVLVDVDWYAKDIFMLDTIVAEAYASVDPNARSIVVGVGPSQKTVDLDGITLENVSDLDTRNIQKEIQAGKRMTWEIYVGVTVPA